MLYVEKEFQSYHVVKEVVSMAVEKGFDIPAKSVKRYANDNDVECVLVRF